MSITARTRRRAAPTAMVAAAATLALLATPLPAAGSSPSRTALLTLTGGSSLSELAHDVAAVGGRVLETLGIADSLLVELPVGTSAPSGATEVPDVAMKVNSAPTSYDTDVPTYRETIDAPADPSTGQGVTVALVDTGVAASADGLGDVEHIALIGEEGTDGLGHGTFLAGIITGSGTHLGVAPGSTLLDVKVADEKGNTSLSTVLLGLQSVAERDVDVVNVSLSTGSPLPPGFDPLARALERLWQQGVTVVTAAGNDGPEWGTVGSPGNTPILITVGALDEAATGAREDDTLAEFSSRGSYAAAWKPDLVAPGVSLVSTAAPESSAVQRNRSSLVDGGYMRGSGTSMSAAVVSGAVAAVLEENASLEPNGVKALLTGTADASNLDLQREDGAGAGALDLGEALTAADGADPDPEQEEPVVPTSGSGPAEDDAAAWAEFAAAWAASSGSDDFDAVARAWSQLSPRTRIWAARAWSMAVVANGLSLNEDEFEARAWSARAWSAEEWLARAWSARAWSARAWSDEEWLARAWSARAWSDEEWLARAWSARAWSGDDWAARAWSARAWSARAWSARAWSESEWSARAWSARAWSGDDWAARAWSARAWSARAWSARAWSEYMWSARAWSARAWSARAWSARAWSARAWSARAWSARAWSMDVSPSA